MVNDDNGNDSGEEESDNEIDYDTGISNFKPLFNVEALNFVINPNLYWGGQICPPGSFLTTAQKQLELDC